MPPTARRRVSGPQRSASNKQATLSFRNQSKVTKPSKGIVGKDTASPKSKKVVDIIEQEELPTSAPASPPKAEVAINEVLEEPVQHPESKEFTKASEEASKLTKPKIEKYWRESEASRLAKRMHQEDLSTHEKILREFDIDTRFGVSIPGAVLCFHPNTNVSTSPALAFPDFDDGSVHIIWV